MTTTIGSERTCQVLATDAPENMIGKNLRHGLFLSGDVISRPRYGTSAKSLQHLLAECW